MNNRGALVSVRCHLWYLNLLRQHLSPTNFAHVRSSCFGPLLEIINFEFQGQLYNVMCRRLQSGCVNKMVLQFRIGNHVVEFGPADFAIMTGLRFNGNTNLPESSTFHQTVFSGQRFLRMISIENRFVKECKQTGGSSETSLKLGYLYIVYGLLVLKDRTQKNIDLGYIHLIDNLDRFLCFPWGRIAYDFMVPLTYNARKLLQKMETKENKLTVEAYGFVHVLQAWAYEIMPSLAAFCGKRVVEHENRIPRMQRWSADSGFLFEDLWPYFLPRVENDPVPIILSPKEYELMDELGIPSSMHPAAPTPVFNSKTFPRKRRLTYEDVEDVGKSPAMKESPRRSSRLIGKSGRIERKKDNHLDDVAENTPATPALSKSTVKTHNLAAIQENANTKSNAFVRLLMEIMEKVDKLSQKLDKIDVKVDHRDATLHEVVLACIRGYFEKQASSHPRRFTGEKNSPLQKTDEHKSNVNVVAGLCESSTFQNLDDPFSGIKGDQHKVSNTEWFSTEWLLQDPLLIDDINYQQPLKPVPLTDNPMKKSLFGDDSKSKSDGFKEKSFFPRTSTCFGHTVKTKARNSEKMPVYTDNLLPFLNLDATMSSSHGRGQNSSTVAIKFDPSDLDFNYAELNPFLRWQKAAAGGDRRYDRRLPIKMLRVADYEWFDDILKSNGWLESEHINALMYLLLVGFNKQETNRIIRDWSCVEMVCWLALRSDNLEEMVGIMMPYVRGSLPFIGGLEWINATRVFGVAHINGNHWCFYEICIPDQRIVVYDSLNYDWDTVAAHFVNVRKNLPILCRLGRVWERCNYSNALVDSWDVVKFENAPQQTNHSDCGILAMKYMECRAYGVPLDSIKPERGPIFRRRYVVRLFESSYEP